MQPAEKPLSEPRVSVGQVVGLLEAVDEAGGTEDAARVAREGKLHADSIPMIIALAQQLQLVDVDDGDVILRDHGRRVLAATIRERKKVFREVLNEQEWMKDVMRLAQSRGGTTDRSEVVAALGAKHGAYHADSLFTTAVYWGRYCGLLKYNSRSEQLHLVP